MAEPLSFLTSIAGVAAAGAQISMSLYDIAHRIKRAPKEVSEMAKELSLLASVLHYMRIVIEQSSELCKPQLIIDMTDILTRIKELFTGIKQMTRDSSSSIYSLKLLFRSNRTKRLLARVEGFKATISLILGTVQLATLQNHISRSQSMEPDTGITDLRKLLESLLLANRESITKLGHEEQSAKSFLPPAYEAPTASSTSDVIVHTTSGIEYTEASSSRRPASPTTGSETFHPLAHLSFQPVDQSSDDDEESICLKGLPRSAKRKEKNEQGKENSLVSSSSTLREEDHLQIADWNTSPDDSAIWLYSLVFSGSSLGPVAPNETVAHLLEEFPFEDTDIERTVDNLVTQWTLCPPHVQLEPTPASLDSPREEPDWSDVVKKNVRQIEQDVRFKPEHREPKNSKTRKYRPPSRQYRPPSPDFEDDSSSAVGHGRQSWDIGNKDDRHAIRRRQENDEDYGERYSKDQDKMEHGTAPTSSSSRHYFPSGEHFPPPPQPKGSDIEEVPAIYADGNPYANFQDIPDKQSRDRGRRPYQDAISEVLSRVSPLTRENHALETEDTAEIQAAKTKLTALKEKLVRANQARDYATVSDVMYYAIPDVQERLNKLEAENRQTKNIPSYNPADYGPINGPTLPRDAPHYFFGEDLEGQSINVNNIEPTSNLGNGILNSNPEEPTSNPLSSREVHFAHEADPVWDIAYAFSGLDLKPRFSSRPLSVQNHAMLGLLLWSPPMMPDRSEIHDALTFKGWKPLWMRSTKSGETWFLGRDPILMNFFDGQYRPQIGHSYDKLKTTDDDEDSFVCIGAEWVEVEAMLMLKLSPKGQAEWRYFFDASLTWNDIDQLVATSFFIRESRVRKKCRKPVASRV